MVEERHEDGRYVREGHFIHTLGYSRQRGFIAPCICYYLKIYRLIYAISADVGFR